MTLIKANLLNEMTNPEIHKEGRIMSSNQEPTSVIVEIYDQGALIHAT